VFDAEPIRQTGHKTVRNYGNPRHSQAPQSGVDFPPSGFGHGAGWFAAANEKETQMSETISRAEHLEWCKKRALEYVNRGDTSQAFASMGSDLGKHPETANHPAIQPARCSCSAGT
jgi:hypothetical protein